MKFARLAPFMILALVFTACGPSETPPEAKIPEATPTLTVLQVQATQNPYSRSTVVAATAVADDLGALPRRLLNIRLIPEFLLSASSISERTEVVAAWTEFLSDSELLDQRLVPRVVMCSGGTGRLTGVIPDDPAYAAYKDTPFDWEIVRTAANSGAQVTLRLTFDPALDQFMFDSLNTPSASQTAGGSTSAIDRGRWDTLLDIDGDKVVHGISNRVTSNAALTNAPGRGAVGNLADVIESKQCENG